MRRECCGAPPNLAPCISLLEKKGEELHLRNGEWWRSTTETLGRFQVARDGQYYQAAKPHPTDEKSRDECGADSSHSTERPSTFASKRCPKVEGECQGEVDGRLRPWVWGPGFFTTTGIYLDRAAQKELSIDRRTSFTGYGAHQTQARSAL